MNYVFCGILISLIALPGIALAWEVPEAGWQLYEIEEFSANKPKKLGKDHITFWAKSDIYYVQPDGRKRKGVPFAKYVEYNCQSEEIVSRHFVKKTETVGWQEASYNAVRRFSSLEEILNKHDMTALRLKNLADDFCRKLD